MPLGKILIWSGLGLLALGLTVQFFPRAFSWFGRLPGDLRSGDENGFLFIPVTSMIVISLILSLVSWWLRR